MMLYPFKFKPLFKQRIWGGTALYSFFNKPIPAGRKIGESWELTDLPDNHSEIANGDLAGQTLNKVIERYRTDVTGRIDWQQPFPLLIKILDADDILSVQVHPDYAACKKMGEGSPKTECWYIIDARPGAFIYKGLKPGTTADVFKASIQNGNCVDFLVKVPVKPGECHFLPPGTCHAIGSGLLIAEIQQPSDTTYRVFDWNRLDPDTGKPRPLHIEQAMESIRFNQPNDILPVRTEGRLVDAVEFKVDKLQYNPGDEVCFNPGIMRAVIVISGSGQLIDSNNSRTPFVMGDTLLIPAACQSKAVLTRKTEMLIVTI
ncbi:MAG: mannose-6-phosphate isomerase [Planctomycetes bacterium]|nr:mannose-6-phosphate isomerase [Planctomycetota bacterium]